MSYTSLKRRNKRISEICKARDFDEPWYKRWCCEIGETPRFHRKQWEFAFIMQALWERGCIEEGKKGLVFAVGSEPLPSIFAKLGCSILATDIQPERGEALGWANDDQLCFGSDGLNAAELCPPDVFSERVRYRPVDMNDIPDDLTDFDFNWSSCSFEHLGSIEKGLAFLRNQMVTLKPGGWAVHTTEFNCTSNKETIDNNDNTVVFRKKDLKKIVAELKKDGHYVEPLDFSLGDRPEDIYVDPFPYKQEVHLKLQIEQFTVTSIGLIMRKGGGLEEESLNSLEKNKAIEQLQMDIALMENIADIHHLTGFQFESLCRKYCHYAYLGNNKGICRVLAKYKLYVDVRDTSLAPHLIMDGFWETWLTKHLAQIIKAGDVCLDIGANLGYFSILMSALSGAGGKTIAVEPNPNLCTLLRATASIHSFGFEVAEVAVSDKEERLNLFIPETQFGDASLLRRSDGFWSKMSKHKIKTVTLDLLAERLNLSHIDVIKMDVEGLEPQVFKGMQRIIRSNPELKIIIEYSPFLYQNPKEFTEYLFQNFTIHRIKDVDEATELDEEDIEELVSLQDHTDLYLQVRQTT